MEKSDNTLSSRREAANKAEMAFKVSISTTIYEQLLHPQISKAQKNIDSLNVCFALLGSARVKAARKMLMKSTQGLRQGQRRLHHQGRVPKDLKKAEQGSG